MKKMVLFIFVLMMLGAGISACASPTPQAAETPVLEPTAIVYEDAASYLARQTSEPAQFAVTPPLELIANPVGDSISQESADTLKRLSFVPVSTGELDYLSVETAEGEPERTGLIPLPNMSTDNGETLTLDVAASLEGDWYVYKGEDGEGNEIARYSPKSVACSGECATVIWFGTGEAAGATLILDMEPDTGRVKRAAQVFYTDVEDDVKFELFYASQWTEEISGADALMFAVTDGASLVYESESKIFSFTGVDEVVHGAGQDAYHYVEGFGGYVDIENEDGGSERYVLIDGNYVPSERMESLNEAPVYKLGNKYFVERKGTVEWVDSFSTDEANGDAIINVGYYEDRWNGADWVPNGPVDREFVEKTSSTSEIVDFVHGKVVIPKFSIKFDSGVSLGKLSLTPDTLGEIALLWGGEQVFYKGVDPHDPATEDFKIKQLNEYKEKLRQLQAGEMEDPNEMVVGLSCNVDGTSADKIERIRAIIFPGKADLSKLDSDVIIINELGWEFVVGSYVPPELAGTGPDAIIKNTAEFPSLHTISDSKSGVMQICKIDSDGTGRFVLRMGLSNGHTVNKAKLVAGYSVKWSARFDGTVQRTLSWKNVGDLLQELGFK